MKKSTISFLFALLFVAVNSLDGYAQSNSDFNFDSELLANQYSNTSNEEQATVIAFDSALDDAVSSLTENSLFLQDQSAEDLLAKSRRKKTMGFIFGGIGAAMLVPGIIGLTESSKADPDDADNVPGAIVVGAGKVIGTAVSVMLISGGVLSGAGSALFFARSSKLRKRAEAQLSFESGFIVAPGIASSNLNQDQYVGLKLSLDL